MRLHLITPENSSFQTLIQAIPPMQDAFDMLHLRLHTFSDQKLLSLVRELRNQSFPDAKLILHDRPHLVAELGLSHVQIGFRSPRFEVVKKRYPFLKIGVSVHSTVEMEQAKEADFFMLGHIYQTASKPDKQPLGEEETEKIMKTINQPVIAIGGIQPSHIATLHQIGFHGFAVMSGVLNADKPAEAIASYNRARRELDV
ncbi:thiazole tautomerase (transcriptional regulator TenI) [Thermoactinomyces sp. DSM 45891]|uniref:thiamine phosphate synthase n=1 Tax=Thermoactinomyces sp. DSM 45891 TaxID=1761907 RepID=UPI00091D2099|nr:thiamine phosphate synthase [Thermoactinomyces sp. DSM 45891]SFX52519.1 thiazole tautomerase (transcriptional regulator TenI) [Thermoactinomyces sp. DSM 45891]